MTSDADDALSWDGDDDQPQQAAPLPRGWKALGKGSESIPERTDPETADAAVVAVDEADEEEAQGLSTGALLALGVLGGVYLLYTIGWVVGGLRLQTVARFLVADAMYLPWLVLAIAAPALWFLATWVLTRGKAGWVRMLALIGGVLLLVPWPFVMVGAIGS